MKKIIFQLRLLIMTYFLRMAIKVCPKDALRTLEWFTKVPLE